MDFLRINSIYRFGPLIELRRQRFKIMDHINKILGKKYLNQLTYIVYCRQETISEGQCDVTTRYHRIRNEKEITVKTGKKVVIKKKKQ